MIIEKKYCGDKKLLEMVEQAVDHLDSTSIADILTGMGYHNGNTLPVEIHQVSGHKDWGLPYTPSEVASEMKGSAHEAQHRSEKTVVGMALPVYAPKGTCIPFFLPMYSDKIKDHVLVVASAKADEPAYTECAYLGDIQALTAARNGCRGIIVDGAVRDRKGLQDIDMPVWARGFRPNPPRKEQEGKINDTITIQGAIIESGDIVVADANGIVVIPKGIVPEVLEKAAKKEAADEARKSAVEKFDFKAVENPDDHNEYDSIMNLDIKAYLKSQAVEEAVAVQA